MAGRQAPRRRRRLRLTSITGASGPVSRSSSHRGAWRLAHARLTLPVNMERRAGGWVTAMPIWPITTTTKTIATTSWMKVAPVRHERGQ